MNYFTTDKLAERRGNLLACPCCGSVDLVERFEFTVTRSIVGFQKDGALLQDNLAETDPEEQNNRIGCESCGEVFDLPDGIEEYTVYICNYSEIWRRNNEEIVSLIEEKRVALEQEQGAEDEDA